MICPRCDSQKTDILVNAPLDDAWVLYACGDCNFTWRSTETGDGVDPENYPVQFKIDRAKIPDMMVNPPLP